MCPWEHTSFLNFYLFILEGGEGREKERERNSDVREKHWLAAFCTHSNQAPKPPPRHVPWLGIKPVTFRLAGHCPINWATQAGMGNVDVLKKLFDYHLHSTLFCVSLRCSAQRIDAHVGRIYWSSGSITVSCMCALCLCCRCICAFCWQFIESKTKK